MKKWLIAVVGPTASGKTDLSIELAENFKTEIISADSRQFYRELNIGVAKPSPEQLSKVSHHFIGHLSILDPYNAGKFEADALALLDSLFRTHDVVILTGGSGLFVKAVLEGFDKIPPVDEYSKNRARQAFREKGITFLQEELQIADPAYLQHTDPKNPVRLIRALEVFYSTGKPFSSFHLQKKTERSFQTIQIGLDVPRAILYERIDTRIEEMIRNGLPDEAKNLFAFRHLEALQTVGYAELFDFLEGKNSFDEAVALIRQHSRNFAKRQMTWFNKMKGIRWMEPSSRNITSFVQGEIRKE